MTDSVLSKSARGSIYNIAVAGITILLGFTRSVLLMRLLGVEAFGVLTLALFFSTFVVPFSSLGIDNALIQKKDPPPEAFSTHFTVRMGLSLVIALFGLLTAPLLRLLYDPMVIVVYLILLLVNIFESSYATHTVIIRREMQFGTLALMNLGASLVMTIISPLLAYLGAGIWSLVAEQVLGPLFRWVVFWIYLRPWKFSLVFKPSEAKNQIRFGSHVVASNLLGVVLDRFDDFWTGTVLGSSALGYYSRAYEMAQYPQRVLATPITNVFFSIYANLQEQRQNLSRAFFRSSCYLVRAGLILAIILVLITPELVLILFTEKWLPIIPLFRLMMIYIILEPFYANTSSLIIGIGYPALLTRIRLIQAVTFIILVITMAYFWQVNGVALATNLMMLLGTTALVIISKRYVDYSVRRMFLAPLISSLVSITGAIFLIPYVHISQLFGLMMVKAAIAASIYVFTLFIFEWKDIRKYGLASIQMVYRQIKEHLDREQKYLS
jgi:PST family polysaccharide transporter